MKATSLKEFYANLTTPEPEEKPISTLEMEIAVMKWLNPRQKIVVPNLSWGMIAYEADVVALTPNNYGTEIEIKISRSDFLADFKKNIQHDSELFKYFYYAVPKEMKDYVLERLPERAGLLVVSRRTYTYSSWKRGDYQVKGFFVGVEKEAQINPHHRQWTIGERLKLAELGAMRILSLKEKYLKDMDV